MGKMEASGLLKLLIHGDKGCHAIDAKSPTARVELYLYISEKHVACMRKTAAPTQHNP